MTLVQRQIEPSELPSSDSIRLVGPLKGEQKMPALGLCMPFIAQALDADGWNLSVDDVRALVESDGFQLWCMVDVHSGKIFAAILTEIIEYNQQRTEREAAATNLSLIEAVRAHLAGEVDQTALLNAYQKHNAAVEKIHTWKRVYSISYLGGDEMERWTHHIHTFVALARAHKCNALRIAGRRGWGRLFPFMQERSRVFELPLEVE